MSGLKCLGKSLKGAEKQVTVQAVRPCTTQTAKKMPIGKKAAVVDKPHKHRGSNCGSPHSDQPAPVRELVVSRVGAAAEELINTNVTSGAGEPVCLAGGEALHHDPLLSSTRPPHSPPPSPPHSEGSDKRRAAPPSEPLPQPEPHSKEEEQVEDETDNKEEEEEDEEDEEKEGAPLELMAEFLSSLMRRDLGLASRLCQMILVYEPENPEAVQFLPLIQQKVLEDQGKELGTDDEDDDDEDEEDDSDEDSDNSESCDEGLSHD